MHKLKILLLIFFLYGLNLIAQAQTEVSNVNNFMLYNNYNISQYDNLWERIIAGFKMNHQENSLVKYYEKFYSSNPKLFNQMLKNSMPYLYFILGQVERVGEPSEVALIPYIESNYNEFASTKASSGLWQFETPAANRFNLNQNYQIDERKDIVKSTNAAIIYIDYLHDLFGQWDLAIAGYNWGEGNIHRVITALHIDQQTPIDFYQLQLRNVTKHYIPKIIALANIITDPKKFNITLPNYPNQAYFSIIQPIKSVTYNNLSQQLNNSSTDFRRLNPQYKKLNFLLTSNSSILLNSIDSNYYNQQNLTVNSINNTISTINSDNLIKINQKLISVSNLESPILITNKLDTAAKNNSINQLVNELVDADSLTNVANIKSVAPLTVKYSKNINFNDYQVKLGDTIYSIAKKFHLTIEIIKNDNHININTIKINQILLIRNITTYIKS